MTYFVLVCQDCADDSFPLPMPFTNAEDRGKWAAAHKAGTTHDRWRVWQEDR